MAVIFEVKVVPNSGRHGWVIDKSGKLKCFLKSPPEKGLANEELIGLISKALKLPKFSVQIISGMASRNKKIKIDINSDLNQILLKLGVDNIDLSSQKSIV